jgi:uncharacterized protein (DUF305 family)
MSYKKFTIMMLVSFVIMYVVMFLNVIEIVHYHTSITRIYMTVLMVSAMGATMMLMMRNMYPDKKVNMAIIAGSVLIFIATFIGLRSQTPIGDVQYMKAMIPHHSSAILTSERANISDPAVKKLAEEIIKAQRKEIAEMEAAIERLEE